jgi:folate-binding Fe-S cluster repair protein YgfZ
VSDLSWRGLAVQGADALSFLQGQLTQDLFDENATWSLLLAPDSSTLATVYVTRQPHMVLTVPAAMLEDVAGRLNRFRLRVDVRLSECEPAVVPLTEEDLFNRPWPHAEELASHLLPHAYGVAVTSTCISESKGCYTGQELVGRLSARGGNTPWRLTRSPRFASAAEVDAYFAQGPEGPKGRTRLRTGHDGQDVWWEGLGIAHRSVAAGG